MICSCHLSTLSSRHGVSRDPEGFACYYWRCAYGVATRFWTAPRLSAEVQARSTMCQTSISPYTRGNLLPHKRQRGIPVHTGKPVLPWDIRGVYPRTHGETLPSQRYFARLRRVYPRTHGETSSTTVNVRGVYPRTHGETLWHQVNARVYPRTHGETWLWITS